MELGWGGDNALRHVTFITNMYILHHLSSFANENVIGARIINLSGARLPKVFNRLFGQRKSDKRGSGPILRWWMFGSVMAHRLGWQPTTARCLFTILVSPLREPATCWRACARAAGWRARGSCHLDLVLQR